MGSQLTVIVTPPGSASYTRRFGQDIVTIGSAPDRDLVLDDPGVAPRHAEIVASPAGLTYLEASQSPGSAKSLGSRGSVAIAAFRVEISLETARHESTESTARFVSSGLATPLGRVAGHEAVGSEGGERRSAEGPRPASVVVAGESPAAPVLGSLSLRVHRGKARKGGAVLRFPGRRDVRIGRDEESHVCFDNDTVSRRHARLSHASGGWQVTDLGSRNGTQVNGRGVATCLVRPGDRITFGPDVEIEVIIEDEASPAGADEGLLLSFEPSSRDDRAVVVRVRGRVDTYTYVELELELGRTMDTGVRYLLVDMTDCTFCDHMGLRVLVAAQNRLARANGGLRMFGLNQRLKDAMALLRLDAVLQCFPTEVQAARSL